MKNTLTVLFLFFAFFASAQTPQRINYQGVARGADGAPVTDQDIGIRFEILQGSATGSVVYTEQQAIVTSSLGMILTQIGISNNLQTVNWLIGPFFLRVSVDFDGGTDFVELGTQQMMSVPFSLHAATVPGTYTPSTNVIELGGNTFTLSSTPITTITPDGIVSLSNPTTNAFVVSVPEPTFTPSGPVTITGNYPNLSVNSPSIPPTTTIDVTGIANVTNASTNSFVIGVPEPTFTPSGPVTITGTYPNLAINSPSIPPTTTVGAVGIATVANAATNSFVVGVPQPTFTSTGPVTIGGTYPNLTVTSPTVAPTATILPAGVVSVTNSGVNAFVVGVPPMMVTVTGSAGVSGASSIGTNSFNINIPAGVTPTITGGGAVTVAPANIGNNFTLTVPQTSVSLTQTVGATGISSAGTNSYNINVTPAVTPTITPFGVLTRTAVGSSYSLTVPGTSLTQSGAAIVNSTGTNSFNVHVPQSTVTASGAAAVTSAGTNSFNVNVPASNVVVTSTPGVVGFNSPGTNSFNINVPPAITPTISPFGVLTRTAAGSSFSLTVPGTSVTSTGVANVTTSGTNTFNINVPPTGVVVTSTPGVVGFNSIGTNSFNINVPPAITPTVTGTGLAVSTSTGSAFTVNVPLLTYTPATGALGSGVNSVNITPSLSLNGTTLSVGPSTNSVDLVGASAWTETVGAVITTNTLNNVGVGVTNPGQRLTVDGNISLDNQAATNAPLRIIGFPTATTGNHDDLIVQAKGNIFSGTIFAGGNLVLSGGDYNHATSPSDGHGGSVLIRTGKNVFNGSGGANIVFQAGGTTTTHTERMRILGINGFVGMGTATPSVNLHVQSATSSSAAIISGAAANSNLMFGTSANIGLGRITYTNVSNTMSFWTNASQKMALNNDGQLIIGNNTPVLANTGLLVSRNGAFDNRIVITGGDDNNFYGGILTFAENLNHVAGMSIKLDAGGNRMLFTTDLVGLNPIMGIGGYSGATPGVAIGSSYASGNAPVNGLIVEGNVGVGTNIPSRRLEVAGNGTFLSDNLGQTTLYHNSGSGNALLAESNNNGNSTVGGSTYARAMLAGINANSPMGNVNSGVWGSVTGQGAGGYGVMASYGNFGLYSTYVGLAGSPYAGIFMGGNVGIGTTAPTAALQVVGNGLFSGNVGIQNTAPQANLELGTTFSLRLHATPRISSFRSVNYAPELFMDMGFGEISYRTSNDNWATFATEYVFGTNVPSGTASFRAGLDNTKSLGAAGIRWTTVFAANGVINTSDAREKNSIRNLTYGLADVMKLRPVVFKWNNDPKNEDKIGLIAQEVKAVIGEVVKGGEDFGPKFITNEKGEQVENPNYADRLGIFYSDLIPVVIKAMQEQQQIIEAQKAKLDALEARLNALERK